MPGINIVTSVFSLADCTFLIASVSAGSNGIEPWASLFADKMTSCALCFIQFVVYWMRNSVVY